MRPANLKVMLKPDAERLVRTLCRDWPSGQPLSVREHPRFLSFKAWLNERHPEALGFRSLAGPNYDAERWFDDELGQSWRN